MRTIIDIPKDQLLPLDALCRSEGVSRAEMVRQGIDLLLNAKKRQRKHARLEDAFGICSGTGDFDGLDGLAYERKIRAEWADRDRDIDIRLGLLKPKAGRKARKKK